MKRSEMIDSIVKFMERNNEIMCTAEEAADLFLAEVERLGMKPPWNVKVYQKQCKTAVEPDGYGWDEE